MNDVQLSRLCIAQGQVEETEIGKLCYETLSNHKGLFTLESW